MDPCGFRQLGYVGSGFVEVPSGGRFEGKASCRTGSGLDDQVDEPLRGRGWRIAVPANRLAGIPKRRFETGQDEGFIGGRVANRESEPEILRPIR